MDVITSSEQKQNTIEQMNICRQFLKTIYISDITSSDGEYISNEILNMNNNTSSYEWPSISNPPIKLQQIWKLRIQQILCETKTTKLLRQCKLGPWIIPPKLVIQYSYSIYRPPQTRYIK